MGPTKINEKIFDESGSWIQFHKDMRFEQRYRIENDLIFCETIARIRSKPAEVVTQLQQAWDWWDYGKLISFKRNSDHSSDMELKPISRHITRVRIHILPQEELAQPKGIRLTVIYSHHLEGPSSIDVYPRAGTPEEVILRGRFHGVRHHIPVPFVQAESVAKTHLAAESGTLKFPFPKGTGYVGLARRLEGR